MGGKSAAHSLGERFGRLVVTEVDCSNGHALVTAKCDCGGVWVGRISPLRNGATKSCGCLVTDTLKGRATHGMSQSSEYKIWGGMLERCYGVKHKDYRLYGGKGVVVCERWRTSFDNFYLDMGPRPDSKMSIDRIDSSGDYEPANCKWSTATEQARNTSRNVYITYQGKSLTLREWCDQLELSYYVVRSRIYGGWDVEVAFTQPTAKVDIGKIFEYDGLAMTLSQWSRHLGVGLSTLCNRVKSGFPDNLIFTSEKFKGPKATGGG